MVKEDQVQPSIDNSDSRAPFDAGGDHFIEEGSALCLSGGGIRSATFCLGVIQGLASKSWLDKFEYLSTVSGGGYIGGWLSSWITREGIGKVQLELDRSVAAGIEPEEIRRLRQYSNYMSPKTGLSADSFTLAATYFRNLLLNWMILLPLLAAVVLLGFVNAAAVWQFAESSSGGGSLHHLVGIAAALCGVVAVAMVTSDLPEANGHQVAWNQVIRFFLLPMIGGCWALSLLFGAYTLNGGTLFEGSGAWLILALCGVVVHLLGIVAGLVVRSRRQLNGESEAGSWAGVQRRPIEFAELRSPRSVLAAVFSGAAAALLLKVIAEIFRDALSGLIETNAAAASHIIATLALPACLLSFQIGTAIYATLVSKDSDDGPREWWGRSGGYLMAFGLAWIGYHVLVIWIPNYLYAQDWAKWVAGAGGGAGIVTSIWGYFSKAPVSDAEKPANPIMNMLSRNMLAILAALFIVSLLAAASIAWTWVASLIEFSKGLGVVAAIASVRVWEWLGLLLLAGSAALLASHFVGINTFSMQSLYRNRLVRAYLGSTRSRGERRPHAFTGFDPDDDIGLSECGRDGKGERQRLKHVINAALNVTMPADGHLEWQQRKARPFYMDSASCGVDKATYPTEMYFNGISLGEAVSISGAAASPNMGYHTSSLVAFVMTVFNVRLGAWLPNPMHKRIEDIASLPEPRLTDWPLLAELLGRARTDGAFAYLSDGGHFENLGLYEIVRRQKRLLGKGVEGKLLGTIVSVDASCDPDYVYEDLENCIRKIRIDLGATITFAQSRPSMISTRAASHIALGKIDYGDGNMARLVYIKPALTGNEPLDVIQYAARCHKTGQKFPHHSTMDQFFDESQFESYRILGLRSVDELGSFSAGKPLWQLSGVAIIPVSPATPDPADLKSVPSLPPSPEKKSAADDTAELLDKILGAAKNSGTSLSAGQIAGWGATLITVPALATYVIQRPAQNLIVSLPEQHSMVMQAASAMAASFRERDTISLPLFSEARDCNPDVSDCASGLRISPTAVSAIRIIGERIVDCAARSQTEVELRLTGFASSSVLPSSFWEIKETLNGNAWLADMRACRVWSVLQPVVNKAGSDGRIWVRLKLQSWAGASVDSCPIAKGIDLSAYNIEALNRLDNARWIDSVSAVADSRIDDALAQMNRRVDLVPYPMPDAERCSVQEIASKLPNLAAMK